MVSGRMVCEALNRAAGAPGVSVGAEAVPPGARWKWGCSVYREFGVSIKTNKNSVYAFTINTGCTPTSPCARARALTGPWVYTSARPLPSTDQDTEAVTGLGQRLSMDPVPPLPYCSAHDTKPAVPSSIVHALPRGKAHRHLALTI